MHTKQLRRVQYSAEQNGQACFRFQRRGRSVWRLGGERFAEKVKLESYRMGRIPLSWSDKEGDLVGVEFVLGSPQNEGGKTEKVGSDC